MYYNDGELLKLIESENNKSKDTRFIREIRFNFTNNTVDKLENRFKLIEPTTVEQLMKLCKGTGFGCSHGTTEVLQKNAEEWLDSVNLITDNNNIVLAMVDTRPEHYGSNEHRIYLADPNGRGQRKFGIVTDGDIADFIQSKKGWIPARWRK